MILFIGVAFVSFVIGYLVKKKKIKDIIIRPGVHVIFVSILAPVLQILLLRNHSINHECSMVKIGWILAFFPLLFAVFMQYFYKEDINCGISSNSKKSISTVCMRFFFILMFLGYVMEQPFATQNFLEIKNWKGNYGMEEAIYNITDFNDLCFSFDVQIGDNESAALAIAEKCVHRVSNIEEIEDYISKVNGEIDSIFFVIDYQAEGKNESQNEVEMMLLESKEHIYEDERYCIVIF